MPEYDNALLSHADRARFISAEHRGQLGATARPIHGTVLVDGVVRATWRIERGGAVPGLFVDHVGVLSARDAGAVAAEGQALMALLEPDEGGDVTLVRLDG